jgi:heat shock protein HslJ
MTRLIHSFMFIVTRLFPVLLASLTPAAMLPGCAATSTDTGNPPLVDDHRIRIMPSADGVRVSADAGTVSPAGAEVRVTNVTSGDSETTTATDDGSFEVEIAGSTADDYRIVVTANGESTSITVKANGGGNGDAGNGGASNGDPSAALLDREFLLDSSDGYEPVAGTTVNVRFSEEGFGFSAGCNSHFGEYSLCDGKLCIVGLGSTDIGCDPERSGQDAWLADFFTSEPALELGGDQLTFTGEAATLVFLDREVANPDRPLTGRTWTVDTFIMGGAASNLPVPNPPTLVFGADGAFSAFTGCNDASGTYAVEGEEITFSALASTRIGCMGAATDAEQRMLMVLDGTVTYAIDAQRLTLLNGDIGIGATTE